MKKILFILFCLIIHWNNVFASPTLILGGTNTSPGNTIKLALTLSNQGTQVSSISTDISYDSNVFESVIPEIGPAGSNAGKKVNANDIGGMIRVAIFSMNNNNIINDGVVAYLNLKVKLTATRVTLLDNTPSGADQSDNDIAMIGNTAQIFLNTEAISHKILTEQSSSLNIAYDEYVRVFGSAGVNTINVESGAQVECVNFVGPNEININDYSSDFTVYRLGATVYLESPNTGTMIKIPVTLTSQKLRFADGSSNLVIINGISDRKVMIGNQEIKTTKGSINTPDNTDDTSNIFFN